MLLFHLNELPRLAKGNKIISIPSAWVVDRVEVLVKVS
jgi:hypothetical protein